MAKKIAKKKRPRPPGDSPINIGGGGGRRLTGRRSDPFASIEFKHTDYRGSNGVYTSDTRELDYVLVNGDRVPNVGRNTPILIFYERGLFIHVIPVNQGKMGLSFIENNHFPRNGDTHLGQGLLLLKVKIGPNEPVVIPVGAGGKIDIQFHTKFKEDRSRAKKR